VTHDSGKTWSKIVNGLRGYVHVVVEDPKQPSLLYCGTELGFFISFDAGQNWTDFRLGLPPLPVYDLKVHARDNDLIIATHARGFYVLDDATPLQQLAEAMNQKVALFPPSRGTRYNRWMDTSTLGSRVWVAENKPYGSIISYYLAEAAPSGKVKIEIATGKTIRTFDGPGARGLNRAVWDLREDTRLKNTQDSEGMWGGLQGVRVLPGEYVARLTAFDQTHEQKLEVRMDPRINVSPDDMNEYYKATKRLTAMQLAISQSLERIRRIDTQLTDAQKTWSDAEAVKQAHDIQKGLSDVRDDLTVPRYFPEHLNLLIRVGQLTEEVGNYSGRPTLAQEEYIGVFEGQVQGVLKRLNDIVTGNLKQLNDRLAAAHVPNISPQSELAETN